MDVRRCETHPMAMRELLYVSDAKLEQFVEDRPRRSVDKISGEVETSLIASLKLRLSGERSAEGEQSITAKLKKLDRVVDHLMSTERPPLWWQDEDVTPGRWVEFEYSAYTLNLGETLIVWTPLSASQEPYVLVLHGSSHHIVGNRAPVPDGYSPGRRVSSNAGYFFATFGTALVQVEHGDEEMRHPSSPFDPRLRTPAESVLVGLLSIQKDGVMTEGVVSGFARVTLTSDVVFNLDRGETSVRTVFATPLYIERL